MKRLICLLFPTIYIILFFGCAKEEIVVPAEFSNNALSSEMDSKVDEIYEKHREQLNTIGLSIGILKDGETYFYGYGEVEKGTGVVPDENTYYEIGSITKTFTAILTTKMLLQENLDIETTIKPYLPNDLPTLNRNGIEVNFKHLLTHTSGLPRMPANFSALTNASKAYAEYDERKLYAYLENVRLRADPFTQFSYSNLGMGTLGVIMERNYDKDYGEILNTELLTQLDLLNTTAYFKEGDTFKWATGYSFDGEKASYWKSLNALDGAGVINSTANDLIKYAEANISPPDTPLGDAIKLTHGVYFTEYDEGDYYKIRNCLGWFEYVNNSLPDETFLWHNGGTGGFNSELFISLDHQSALVLLFNKSSFTSERENLIADMLQLLLE